jgi:hypothetical protein
MEKCTVAKQTLQQQLVAKLIQLRSVVGMRLPAKSYGNSDSKSPAQSLRMAVSTLSTAAA